MALETAYYLVSRDIARRAGVDGIRYRSIDGRYVLDNKDLARVRFTVDEYTSGLRGVQRISEEEAQRIIRQGGYRRGAVAEREGAAMASQHTEQETGQETGQETEQETEQEVVTEGTGAGTEAEGEGEDAAGEAADANTNNGETNNEEEEE